MTMTDRRGPGAAEFEGTAAELGGLTVTMTPGGLFLGNDHQRSPVTLRLFRSRPTRVVLIDQGWIDRILIFRALALGARVVIHTAAAEQWANFGASVTGRPDRLLAAAPDRPVEVPASITQPVLYVTEGQRAELPRLGPWEAQVTVAQQFGDYVAQTALEADLLIMRRLSPHETAFAASLLRTTAIENAALQTVPADGVVLFGPGTRRYVKVVPTPAERRLYGTPGAT